jgi:hypothetical protein
VRARSHLIGTPPEGHADPELHKIIVARVRRLDGIDPSAWLPQ